MNAWPEDEGATLVALRALDADPAPVPALPLVAVLRRGRRRRATRAVSGLGLAAAATLVAFLLLPGSGQGPVRLGPATQLTSTTVLDPGASARPDPRPLPASPLPVVSGDPGAAPPVTGWP